MSEAAAQSRTVRGLAARLWEYQAERFPVFKHGVLIAAFGASAVCLSALLRGATPSWLAVGVAVAVLFGFFFQLRVADEHKDNEDDTKYRPERPVPRGLVTLGELRVVAIVVGGAQVGLTAWLDARLIVLLLAVWGWLAIMTKEFFFPQWLKKRPLIYMVSHMAIMPLIDLYATACDWLPNDFAMHEGFGLTLGAFLLLSLVNGSAIEIARKSWAPEQEREGVETYSKLWKPGPAGVAVMAIVLSGLALAAFINVRSQAGVWFLSGLVLVSAWAAWTAIDYAGTPTPKTAKALETSSGVFVLCNYLLLGVLPLLVSLWL
ncbi:MAG TPA: UbiA family prenyltransferase [Hyphomonadaceae bacterium]|nr:UbiA family prenyltransferase [Hyphomonadaceae bacterium]HPI48852.1 UbiA family prenyltransferase [Hyphomonadaceae bacterium]